MAATSCSTLRHAMGWLCTCVPTCGSICVPACVLLVSVMCMAGRVLTGQAECSAFGFGIAEALNKPSSQG